jgi:CheY-like chemotaxis protein
MAAPNPSILVVDDDKNVQYVLKRVLEDYSYDVRVADDGYGALAALKQRPANVILLDILMPEKDGLETVLQLRREYPEVIVIAMSGATFDFLSTAQKFGANHTLNKPIHPDTLIALLKRIGVISSEPRSRAEGSKPTLSAV